MRPIRVGVIGAGWGQVQIEAFRRVKGIEVAALCEADPIVGDRIAQQYRLAHAYPDYRDLISDDVDWISVATPPEAHAEIIRSAIRAGKHVFTERPVSLEVAETELLIGEAQEHAVAHVADFEMRYLPANSYVKELIDEDYLGRVLRVDVTMSIEHPWGEHGNWAADIGRGGGVLMELGSHFLDLIRWWCGEPKSLVAGVRTNFPTIRVRDSKEKANGKSTAVNVTGDDSFWCTLLLESGAEATMNFVTGARNDPGWTIGIYGSTGAFVNKSGQLWAMREGDREIGLLPIPKRLELGTNPNDPLMWSMAKLIERAAGKIRGDKDSMPFPTFRDSLAVEKLIQAIRTSSHERRWVTLAN